MSQKRRRKKKQNQNQFIDEDGFFRFVMQGEPVITEFDGDRPVVTYKGEKTVITPELELEGFETLLREASLLRQDLYGED
jgi:hypothetical protein